MMRWIVFAEKKKDARGLALTVADCETEATGKEDNAMQSGEENWHSLLTILQPLSNAVLWCCEIYHAHNKS